jgi:ABC-type polar amino acid transport system ATPase subunit
VPSRLSTGDPVVQQALAAAYPDGAADLAAASLHDVSVIHVTATAREASGGQYRRVAVVRVAPVEPDEGFTYKVLSWQGAAG